MPAEILLSFTHCIAYIVFVGQACGHCTTLNHRAYPEVRHFDA